MHHVYMYLFPAALSYTVSQVGYSHPPPCLSSLEPLKMALLVEAKAWKTAYGRSLNARYRASMDKIFQFASEYSKKLSRPILVINNTHIMLSKEVAMRSNSSQTCACNTMVSHFCLPILFYIPSSGLC